MGPCPGRGWQDVDCRVNGPPLLNNYRRQPMKTNTVTLDGIDFSPAQAWLERRLAITVGMSALMIINDPHQLTTHQLAQFNRQAGIGLLVSVVNAVVLVTFLWTVTDHMRLSVWLGAVALTSLLRLYIAHSHAKPERIMLMPGHWASIHFPVTVLVGLAWGSAALFLFPVGALPQQMFLIFMTGATATGALPMYIALPTAYGVYLLCIFGPLMARLFLDDEQVFHVMAVMLPVFAGSLWITARSMHLSLMESLSLHFNFQNLASLDGLTQIPNRRHFDVALTNEWNRAARAGMPLSVILIDVDKFKVYNDTYGHQAGDVCLQRVARTLSDNLRRAGDMVARYGGEEFVLLLHQTPRDEGVVLAERLRVAVENMGIEHVGSEGGVVTISVGGATIIPVPQGQESALLRAADDSLYQAKRTGRNCVVWAAALRDEKRQSTD
ncbi:MAG: GGDEF domain-containing protein [Gammaproteobacteria bacterium]|nr:GGDEF domain-containing protein [Gammaproteobacteria bacterium]